MAKGTTDKIDSLYDIQALTAQQKAVEDLVKKTVAQIKAARKESIEFNVGTKSFDDYNKKIKELEKSLTGMRQSSDAATRSSILLERQKQAEAATAQKLAQQQLAETRLREANDKAAQKEAAAIAKTNAVKNDLKNRPIGSIPSEIKTGDAPNPAASNERVNQLEREQAALDSAAASEGNYGAAKLKSAEASKTTASSVAGELSVLQQNIILRDDLKNKITKLNTTSKEDNALFKAGSITKAEYNKRLVESQTRVSVYKTKVQELNRVIKEDIILEGRAGDAYKQLSAEYNKASLAAKNYQVTLGKTHPTTVAAVKHAASLNKELKTIDKNVGQTGRNVGNYGAALNKFLTPLRTAANILPGLGMSGIILGIGTAITTLVSALAKMGKEFDRSAVAKKNFEEATAKSIETSAKEIVTIDGLVAVAKNENLTREERNKAVKQLQDQYPSYLKNITLEKINSEEATKAINDLKDAVLQKAIADAYAEKIAVLVIKQAETKRKIDKEELKDLNDAIAFRNKLGEARRTGDKATESALLRYGRLTDVTAKNINKYNKELSNTGEELEDLKAEYDLAVAGSIKLTTTQEKAGKKGKDTAEANRKALFEILKAELEFQKEVELSKANDQTRALESRLLALENYGRLSTRLIDEQAKFEKGAKDLTKTEVLKIEKDKFIALEKLYIDFNEKVISVTKNFAARYDASVTDLMKTVSNKIPPELQKILDKFAGAQKAAIKKHKDDLKELNKDIKKAAADLASELQGLFFDIFTNDIERQKNAVQDQIDLLDLQKQKEIELANQTITNAQDKADAIAVIEARAAAKKQQLELKQRQLDQQKARFEKARTIAEIVQSTALAVANALTQVKTLGPGALVLASLIGAIGAVQIARALAQPIPKYKDGTKNHPGGLAVVGDGGKSEGIQLPDGSVYKTPATATVVDMPKGSKVYKDYSNMRVAPTGELQVVDTRAELSAGFTQVVKAIKGIPQPTIYAERAWTRAHRTGSTFRNYLNQRL